MGCSTMRVLSFSVVAFFLVCSWSEAQEPMPPKPGLYDESGLSRRTGLQIPRFPRAMEEPGPFSAPPDDSMRTILLFVDFSDNPSGHATAEFDSLLFSQGSNSMADYYHEVSYGGFTVDGDLQGWYRAPQPYTYYAAGGYGVQGRYPNNAQKLVEDVVALADPGVDFSLYDVDGNDTLDGLFVVHAGPGAEETGSPDDIWSHKWNLSDGSQGCPGAYLTDDGVYVDVYSMEPEEFEDGSLITIGVFCHEFCHVLGTPDLYNTQTGAAVVGRFGLMDAGSWNGSPRGSSPAHLSPLFKYLFGWVEPIAVEREGTVEIPSAQIPAVEGEAVFYRILPNPGGCDWDRSGTGEGEYFLIENRQQVGFDQALPGAGLLIWHVDESQEDNNDQYERLAAIMQADGDPSTRTDGDATDLWRSSVEGFSNSSIPSSSLWDGTPTGASVRNISPSSQLMTADLSVGLLLLGEIYSYPNPFEKRRPTDKVTISYVPTDEERARGITPGFTVTIYNLAGERVRILDGPEEVNAPWRQAFWDGENDDGEEVASGLYFYIIETAEERNKGRLTFIH